jgi:hypothetical protein
MKEERKAVRKGAYYNFQGWVYVGKIYKPPSLTAMRQ